MAKSTAASSGRNAPESGVENKKPGWHLRATDWRLELALNHVLSCLEATLCAKKLHLNQDWLDGAYSYHCSFDT
jgi:hypothetical protein